MEDSTQTIKFSLPSVLHILANPSYEPVASNEPSHCKQKEMTYMQIRNMSFISQGEQASHSNLMKWHLYCWELLCLLSECSAAGPTGWHSCCYHSCSRCVLSNLQTCTDTETQAFNTSELKGNSWNWSMGAYPEARRSFLGFQAQMKTSDSWPRNTVALLLGISMLPSISMAWSAVWLVSDGVAVPSSPFALLAGTASGLFSCWLLVAACFLDSTTSGITASMSDNDSMTLSAPSCKQNWGMRYMHTKYSTRSAWPCPRAQQGPWGNWHTHQPRPHTNTSRVAWRKQYKGWREGSVYNLMILFCNVTTCINALAQIEPRQTTELWNRMSLTPRVQNH